MTEIQGIERAECTNCGHACSFCAHDHTCKAPPGCAGCAPQGAVRCYVP